MENVILNDVIDGIKEKRDLAVIKGKALEIPKEGTIDDQFLKDLTEISNINGKLEAYQEVLKMIEDAVLNA